MSLCYDSSWLVAVSTCTYGGGSAPPVHCIVVNKKINSPISLANALPSSYETISLSTCLRSAFNPNKTIGVPGQKC